MARRWWGGPWGGAGAGDANARVVEELRARFNYASSECAARVLAANRGARGAANVLTGAQDAYLLNVCRAPEQFVVLELCQEVRPTAAVLASWEFFAGRPRRVRVSVARVFPPRHWMVLGEFDVGVGVGAGGGETAVLLEHAQPAFVRFMRFDILSSAHGAEDYYYCALSQIRVYGKTMLEEYAEEEGGGGGGDAVPDTVDAVDTVDTVDTLEAALAALQARLLFLKRPFPLFYSVPLDAALDALRARRPASVAHVAPPGAPPPANLYRGISERLKRLEAHSAQARELSYFFAALLRQHQLQPGLLPAEPAPLALAELLRRQVREDQAAMEARLLARWLLSLLLVALLNAAIVGVYLWRRRRPVALARSAGSLDCVSCGTVLVQSPSRSRSGSGSESLGSSTHNKD